jgi:O-methyltransferase involved in polyketide biosynthesis
MSDLPSEQLSPTAQESNGILGLGISRGQRSAELLAGARAELLPRPEYIAMSRPVGRVISGMLLRLASGDQAKINIVIARPEIFRYLIVERLRDKPEAHYVDLASGFLPRAWQLATELPHLRVTEVDLPEVIAEKQRRFAQARLPLPPNLQMISADLGTASLTNILGDEKVDVVSAEGLLHYLSLETVQRLAVSVRQSLKADGLFIADVSTREMVNELNRSRVRQAFAIFRRNAGNLVGVMEDVAHAQAFFKASGYSRVETPSIAELAERLAYLPKPVAPVALIVMAYA